MKLSLLFAGLAASQTCSDDIAYIKANCFEADGYEPDVAKLCEGTCATTLKSAETTCIGDNTNEYFATISWPEKCDSCGQDLQIVQSPPCSYGPSPTDAVCKAGDACNNALVRAKTSCVGKAKESTMKHYAGQCDGTTTTQGTITQAHGHEGVCVALKSNCCGASANANCILHQGMSSIDQTCKSAEAAPMCTSCEDDCKTSELFKESDTAPDLDVICEQSCTKKYFKSLVDSSVALGQPTCSAMGIGTNADGARKMADKFNFKCTKNANNKYCRDFAPSTTTLSSTSLTCSSPEIVAMKTSGCCFGSMLAKRAASTDSAEKQANGMGAFADDGYFDAIAAMSKECSLETKPCDTGMIIDVTQVGGSISIPDISKEQVTSNKAVKTYVRQIIADKMNVETQNVVITGITAGTATASAGRQLTTQTQVDYTVTVQDKQGQPSSTTLQSNNAALSADPASLQTEMTTGINQALAATSAPTAPPTHSPTTAASPSGSVAGNTGSVPVPSLMVFTALAGLYALFF